MSVVSTIERGPSHHAQFLVQVSQLKTCSWAGRILAPLIAVHYAAVGALSWAQGGSGDITGVVTDASGASVPNAQITATNLGTGLVRTTVSRADGSFTCSLLDPGQYQVQIAAAGFRKLIRGPVTVRTTEICDLQKLTLDVGADTQTVNVTAQEALLQTTSPTLGKVFDQQMVTELPLATRNFTQLLSLQAGVVGNIPDPTQVGTGGNSYFSVGCAREYDNSILIDGVSALGGVAAAPVSIPSPDAVEEFKVQTDMFSAEYGRAGGASVNLITKSGTNHWHGNIFEFFRNEALDANQWFLKQSQLTQGIPNKTPLLRQNQFGGTFGGPIIKNKAFFFFSYQGTRQVNGTAPGTVFTDLAYPLLPSGDRSNSASFANELGAIYGGQTGFFGGGTCTGPTPRDCVLPDGSNINPVALKILQAKVPGGGYFLPTFPANPANPGYAIASFSVPAHFTENQYMFNADYQVTAKHALSFKFFNSPQNTSQIEGLNNVPGFTRVTKPDSTNIILTHTFTISPTLVNELRAGFIRQGGPSVLQDAITDSEVGVTPGPAGPNDLDNTLFGLNGLGWDGQWTIAPSSKRVEAQYSIADTIDKTWGKHSIRAGGIWMHHQINQDQEQSNGVVGYFAWADFLLGQSAAQNGTAYSNVFLSGNEEGLYRRDYRFDDAGAFIQDDYKITPKLTLNLGFRWDHFAWPVDKEGRQGNFEPGRIAEGTFGIPNASRQYTGYTFAKEYKDKNPSFQFPAGVALFGPTLVNSIDWKNFAPRFGFAWSPEAKVSLRGGFGLFFPRTSTALTEDNTGAPFTAIDLVTFSAYGTEADPFTFLGLPPLSAFPYWSPRVYTPGVESGLISNPIDPNIENPEVQQWNLSTQYEFGKNWLLELGYLGSHGVKLLNTLSGNQPGIASPQNPIRGVTTNEATAGNIQDRAPVAGFLADRGVSVSQTTASSKYHALIATLNKRLSNGLQLLSAFTRGKSIDTNSLEEGGTGGLEGNLGNAQTPGNNNVNNHWRLSAFDRKLRTTTSLVYQAPTPFHKSGMFVRNVLGGWTFAGNSTFQTGNPTIFNIETTFSAVKLRGYLTPDLAPGVTLSQVNKTGSAHSRINNYFNSTGINANTGAQLPGSKFMTPGPLDYGQIGRSVPIRGPGQRSMDLMASKSIPIHDQIRGEFRTEFFNAFNWVNFGAADPTVTDPAFGQISSTTVAPRIIQFPPRSVFKAMAQTHSIFGESAHHRDIFPDLT